MAVRSALGATAPRCRPAFRPISDDAIAATIACCKYVYERYGRFPASSGPFRTVLAYQAHRLDEDFYRTFYKEGVLPADDGASA